MNAIITSFLLLRQQAAITGSTSLYLLCYFLFFLQAGYSLRKLSIIFVTPETIFGEPKTSVVVPKIISGEPKTPVGEPKIISEEAKIIFA